MEVSVKRFTTLSSNDSKLQELLTIYPQIYSQIYLQVKNIIYAVTYINFFYFSSCKKTPTLEPSKYISLVNIFFNFPQPGKIQTKKKGGSYL